MIDQNNPVWAEGAGGRGSVVEFVPEKWQDVSYNKFEGNIWLHRQERTAQQGLLLKILYIEQLF